jgi:hypothetical protein
MKMTNIIKETPEIAVKLAEMAHIIGPTKTTWDIKVEDYPLPEEDRAMFLYRMNYDRVYAITTGIKTGRWFPKDTIISIGVRSGVTEVDSIPVNAGKFDILPENWEHYLKVI